MLNHGKAALGQGLPQALRWAQAVGWAFGVLGSLHVFQRRAMAVYAGGELQGSPVWQGLAGHKQRIPLAVVRPHPARGAGTLIPSAQRLVWAAKQALGKAALGALFA